jgi:hypothetical protein
MSKIITKKQLNLVIESTLKENGYVTEDEACPECGATVCECGTSYMDEGDYMDEEKGKYDDGDGKDEKCDYVPCEKDVTEESVNDLVESVSKTFDSSLLTEDMEMFNKLINYRNK